MLLNLRDNFCQGIVFLVMILFFSGCGTLGTYNAATGKKELIFVPTSRELVMGEDVHRGLLKQYSFSSNQNQIQRLQKIGQRVAQVSDRQDYEYKFYLIEDDTLNAFTTPGGHVYIFSGLFNQLTDDQVAAVMAHEIGHCAAKHTIKKYQVALGYGAVGQLLLKQFSPNGYGIKIAEMSTQAITKLVFSSYGRKDEHESDRLGVKYLHLSGYRPEASIEILQLLQQKSTGPTIPLMLRSHPYLKDRIIAVKQDIQDLNI